MGSRIDPGGSAQREAGRSRPRGGVALCVALLLAAVASALPAAAAADQAAQPTAPAAGHIATGVYHSCAVLADGSVRCWGYGGDGALGYGNTDSVGDDEIPASVGPVDLGPGRTAKAISAGDYHTCALLDDGSVRCWGFGGDGRLGYGNTKSIGASQTPGSVGPVDLGPGRTAKAISAGGGHTCAVLDDGSVRCWGYGFKGELGYGNQDSIGDDETPGSVGPVDLGPGRTAVAISSGERHTCALLDNGSVRCWGNGGSGRLGYGNQNDIGDQQTPDTAGPVNLGPGRSAVAITAGGAHTCALLDDSSVRCWGFGASGQLGYGNTSNVGDSETPDAAGPVKLGRGRRAKAISAGAAHTCALLDDGNVRCWGYGGNGRLGYGNTNTIGDAETPDAAGPVDLGLGRTALAISAGSAHTCALLDDRHVRCWGAGGSGRLGYCNQDDIGDDEAPGSAGPVSLELADGGIGCPRPSSPSAGSTPPTAPPAHSGGATATPMVEPDRTRARTLRNCLTAVTTSAPNEQRLARQNSARQRANARRHAASGRRRCLRLYGRTPGRVSGLRARALSKSQIELDFSASGTDANRPPPAQSYLIKQSLGPIRTARDFSRAQTLCSGRCRFAVTSLGEPISLTVADLRPHTSYYYAVAARDNVSARPGPRSHTVKARTA